MMRFGWIALVAMIAALGIGASGLPGDAVSALANWLEHTGHIELQGPVGDAVKEAL